MKTLIFTCVFASASAASAANLINEDPKKYEVALMCDGVTNHTTVNPRSVQEDAVRQGCVITIGKKHMKKLSVKTASDVIIRKGKLVSS